ncbi:S8 family serine peptidase [Anthocerotibacter panamensis]|uniref:S8 family serine peptidase n=1 Tax=Anthocerotibacter panamensis TaxID=2857077 RepID=UPI001C40650B|nr:S8 family serine peptidase [Anthocerotibacter panamensis]
MKHVPLGSRPRFVKISSTLLALSLGVSLLAAPTPAKPGLPQNLGNGLYNLVQGFYNPSSLKTTGAIVPDDRALAITDNRGRILVNIFMDGRVSIAQVKESMQVLGNMTVTAESDRYRAGVIEAFVPLNKIADLARTKGVNSVVMVPKPVNDVGATTSQGVVQHRVDQIPGIDGAGITVAALSDSYNTTGGPISAATDIGTGDLPGVGNPLGNTQPVVVLQDFVGGADEGRAMLQIVHDLAPKAKLCFATANLGEVTFGNFIRALADPAQACNADVIVDDIIYFDEPFFSDGIVAQAVDDVANGVSFPGKKVPYFSSAGNRPPTMAYFSDFRLVPVAGATAGTNINLAGVDPALYAGGFHDFDPGAGVDIAQNISITTSGTITFQWDDPFDATPPVLGATFLSTNGTLTTTAPTASFTFSGTAGQGVSFFTDTDTTNGNGNPDLTLTLLDPSGRQIAFADNGTNPETLFSLLPTTGTYTIVVGGFLGATGDFVLTGQEATATPRITSDFNLLFFDAAGNFMFAQADNNLANNRPIELRGVRVTGTRTIQLVIARANTPAPVPTPASKIRYVWFTSGSPQEYFSYSTPVTFGHNSANGANGVAAYSPFRPFIPEDFTSTGPVTMYFDANNNRLATPEVRLKPDVAAMDGANTTFFTADTSRDTDTFPNFFGTSAAAPHAAAIAALVLQANGGTGSVTPTQMRTVLQRSAFPHDLDPYFARASVSAAGTKITLSASADNSTTGQNDVNALRVSVTGSGSLQSLSLGAQGGNTTGGNVITGSTPGLVFDVRTTSAAAFPFTLGPLTGLTASNITASFANQAPAPSVTNQFFVLNLSITPGAFTGGKSFNFGIDRDEQRSAFSPPTGTTTNGGSADLLGAGVLIPEGTIVPGGATVTGTLTGGTPFSGVFVNRIGAGYSLLDGFGFINAQAAVNAPLPPP